MVELKIVHILMLIIVVLLYRFMSCCNDSFSVGNEADIRGDIRGKPPGKFVYCDPKKKQTCPGKNVDGTDIGCPQCGDDVCCCPGQGVPADGKCPKNDRELACEKLPLNGGNSIDYSNCFYENTQISGSFTKCNFNNTTFSNCSFTKAVFNTCKLDNTQFISSFFNDFTLENCNSSGTSFDKCLPSINGVDDRITAIIDNCKFTNLSITESLLDNFSFTNTTFTNINYIHISPAGLTNYISFYGCKFVNGTFDCVYFYTPKDSLNTKDLFNNTTFNGTTFTHCSGGSFAFNGDITDTKFINTKFNTDVHFYNTIKDSLFQNTNCINCIFEPDANLQNTQFINASCHQEDTFTRSTHNGLSCVNGEVKMKFICNGEKGNCVLSDKGSFNSLEECTKAGCINETQFIAKYCNTSGQGCKSLQDNVLGCKEDILYSKDGLPLDNSNNYCKAFPMDKFKRPGYCVPLCKSCDRKEQHSIWDHNSCQEAKDIHSCGYDEELLGKAINTLCKWSDVNNTCLPTNIECV